MCLKNAGKVKEPRGAPPAGDQKPSVTPAAAPPAPQQDQAEKPIIYAAIVMTVPVGVKALVPADYMEGKEAVENLHITTMFLGGKPPEDVEMFSELEKLEGKTIDVTLVRVVSDAKATAIEVRNNNEFPCQNKHAHITVGLAPGVPAKYSNELLDDSLQHEGERNVLEIPPDTSLPGVFQFVR
uniref:tRNA ligase phosphodiesterase domain-containing protein n=1 Tax=Trypanosoma congolense (strain IL3000) TaxID=1068625 RepID=G0URJ5_TRYCI|nr:conserved hypothetical protein [Trypanosoma congolense IL3000]